jgi:FAD/FMN-containing dehydrogenase
MAGFEAAMRGALGGRAVVAGDDIPARNRADWSGTPPVTPALLVRPDSVEGVAAALRLCSGHGRRVVVQGGMTGLAGGATPAPGEVALSLERLSGVEDVDAAGMTLTALAGTPLAEVQAAAEEAGLVLGLDLGARGSCTIGGNVATNAGGVAVLRYGMTRAQVRGLEVVLADGTVVRSMNRMLKNNTGYDWTQLFVGSEGTLGVVTRVVLGLHPAPGPVATAFLRTAGFDAALAALRRLQAAMPGALAAFEAMWPAFEGFAADCGVRAPLDLDGGMAVIVDAAGAGEGFETALMALIEEGVIDDAVIAKSGEERRRIWAFRETVAEFEARMPDAVTFDVSLPLARMTEAAADLEARVAARWPGARTIVFGHVADSNVHIVVDTPGGAGPGEVEGFVYETLGGYGGSISAEHGIGVLKKPYLPISRSPEELALMRRIKAALDPQSLLGAGRIF